MSINILENFISGADKKTRMPVVSCIGSVTDDENSMVHSWENAVDVDPKEMSCQVITTFSVFCFVFYMSQPKTPSILKCDCTLTNAYARILLRNVAEISP